MLGNPFIDSQFNGAPLIWMLCRKGLYFKMLKIHHKKLKVIYESNKTYEELLELSETVSIHQRHLRSLVTKVYKKTYEELLELSETVIIHQRHLRFLVTKVYKSTS